MRTGVVQPAGALPARPERDLPDRGRRRRALRLREPAALLVLPRHALRFPDPIRRLLRGVRAGHPRLAGHRRSPGSRRGRVLRSSTISPRRRGWCSSSAPCDSLRGTAHGSWTRRFGSRSCERWPWRFPSRSEADACPPVMRVAPCMTSSRAFEATFDHTRTPFSANLTRTSSRLQSDRAILLVRCGRRHQVGGDEPQTAQAAVRAAAADPAVGGRPLETGCSAGRAARNAPFASPAGLDGALSLDA